MLNTNTPIRQTQITIILILVVIRKLQKNTLKTKIVQTNHLGTIIMNNKIELPDQNLPLELTNHLLNNQTMNLDDLNLNANYRERTFR